MRRLRVRFPLGAQNFLSLEACCACAFIYYISLLASYHILPYIQIITLIKTWTDMLRLNSKHVNTNQYSCNLRSTIWVLVAQWSERLTEIQVAGSIPVWSWEIFGVCIKLEWWVENDARRKEYLNRNTWTNKEKILIIFLNAL